MRWKIRGGVLLHKIYPFDLSRIDKLENFCKKIVEENGKIDGLVYCAGIAGTRPLKLLKPEQLLEIFQINLFPFIEIVRCFTRKSAYNPGMSIVGISSVASKQGGKGKTGYCASKGAMDAAVRAMAKELAPGKIRINTICPGLLQTDMYDTARDNGGNDFQNIVERQYLGIGKPEDAASLVAFLLSDASRFITGSSMVVDGGRTTS